MRRIFSKAAVALVLWVIIFPLTGRARAEAGSKIAVINLQVALNTSEAGKTAMEKLKKDMNKTYEAIMAREQEVKDIEERINRQGILMKEGERKEIEEQYYQKRKMLDRLKEDTKSEMTRSEREMSRKILSDIISVARKIGQEEGYTLIMEKGPGVIYVVDEIDITEKVIKRYDREMKRE